MKISGRAGVSRPVCTTRRGRGINALYRMERAKRSRKRGHRALEVWQPSGTGDAVVEGCGELFERMVKVPASVTPERQAQVNATGLVLLWSSRAESELTAEVVQPAGGGE